MEQRKKLSLRREALVALGHDEMRGIAAGRIDDVSLLALQCDVGTVISCSCDSCNCCSDGCTGICVTVCCPTFECTRAG